MLSQALSQLSFQEVLLLLLIIGMQLISVTTLIHGINMAYRVVQPDAGNLIATPQERKEAAARARWEAGAERRERWRNERNARLSAERADRRERDFVSSILDGEHRRRGRDDD